MDNTESESLIIILESNFLFSKDSFINVVSSLSSHTFASVSFEKPCMAIKPKAAIFLGKCGGVKTNKNKDQLISFLNFFILDSMLRFHSNTEIEINYFDFDLVLGKYCKLVATD